MKTRKHGQGMTHKQAIEFSNRLAAAGYVNVPPTFHTETDAFQKGWEAAARYFAHQLRARIRYYEKQNEI